MGWLGHTIREGSAHHRSMAAGAALGLLAGQGTHAAIELAIIWARPNESIIISLLAALLGITLAIVTVTWFFLTRKARSWPWYLATGVASTIMSAAAWQALGSVAMGL